MKKVLSFTSVPVFIMFAITYLSPSLDSEIDDSKYSVTYQILTGGRLLCGADMASRLLHLNVGSTFSFHISLYLLAKDDGRFVTGKRRRFVIKRLSSNNYSVYEK